MSALALGTMTKERDYYFMSQFIMHWRKLAGTSGSACGGKQVSKRETFIQFSCQLNGLSQLT
jgi:hypothetical protein